MTGGPELGGDRLQRRPGSPEQDQRVAVGRQPASNRAAQAGPGAGYDDAFRHRSTLSKNWKGRSAKRTSVKCLLEPPLRTVSCVLIDTGAARLYSSHSLGGMPPTIVVFAW